MSSLVVIPSKCQYQMLTDLLDQLVTQDPKTPVVVFDNGYATEERFKLDQRTDPNLDVESASGWNLHTMWNEGWNLAERLEVDYVIFLNDDVRIGHDFVARIEKGFTIDLIEGDVRHPHPVMVCPSYDERQITHYERTRDICAGRYDESGGFPGFAFALPADYPYRFPMWLEWWSGDSHLITTLNTRKHAAVIIPQPTVLHRDGGSQTVGGTNENPMAGEMHTIVQRDQFLYNIWVEGVNLGSGYTQ